MFNNIFHIFRNNFNFNSIIFYGVFYKFSSQNLSDKNKCQFNLSIQNSGIFTKKTLVRSIALKKILRVVKYSDMRVVKYNDIIEI